MDIFNLIIKNPENRNSPLRVFSFEYDTEKVKNPWQAITQAVTDYVNNDKNKPMIEFLGGSLSWNEIVFCLGKEDFEKYGLYWLNTSTSNIVVNGTDNLLDSVKESSVKSKPQKAKAETSADENGDGRIFVYTDGSCIGNPGPGGWAALIKEADKVRELCGNNPHTTNNAMELTAVITALKKIKESSVVEVFSDSKYVVDSVSKGWIYNWQHNGWYNSSGNPTPNRELWEELLIQLERHKVTFSWVKGHAGHTENERCDTLATQQAAIANQNK